MRVNVNQRLLWYNLTKHKRPYNRTTKPLYLPKKKTCKYSHFPSCIYTKQRRAYRLLQESYSSLIKNERTTAVLRLVWVFRNYENQKVTFSFVTCIHYMSKYSIICHDSVLLGATLYAKIRKLLWFWTNYKYLPTSQLTP